MKEQHFRAFVYYVKRESPSLVSKLNAIVLQDLNISLEGSEDLDLSMAVFGNRTAAPKDKSVIFLLDRTWPPILKVGVDSVAKVFDEYMSDVDTFGLYGLGDGWLVNMAPKGQVTRHQIMMTESVSGACILYSSMLECLETFSQREAQDANKSKWLVVLTDTVDLDPGGHDTRSKVLSELRRIKMLNIAIIDSSPISGYEPHHANWPAWKRYVSEFTSACGDQGHHITANDASAVAAGNFRTHPSTECLCRWLCPTAPTPDPYTTISSSTSV